MKDVNVKYTPFTLQSKGENVYTTTGKFMFSVSMTDRAVALLHEDGWAKGEESWLYYRERTAQERDIEEQKRHAIAKDIVDAFNKIPRGYHDVEEFYKE